MYQEKNNNENKKYNCQCGEAFVTLKNIINITNTTFKKQCQDKFLKIKAKYNVVEPHYMDGSTPKSLTDFLDTLSPPSI